MIGSVNNQAVASASAVHDNNKTQTKYHCDVNTAQYKGADYSNAVRVERNISLDKAKQIADQDPTVDYFCYVKGVCMVLETTAESAQNDPLGLVSYQTYKTDAGEIVTGFSRIFKNGDVVFFNNDNNQKWLGSAPGLCDTYSKVS